MKTGRIIAAPLFLAAIWGQPVLGQVGSERMSPVPPRAGEGEGPYERLVIRGATLIDGSGAPPRGPVDITVAGNRITSVAGAAAAGSAIDGGASGKLREIDARGMYVMPGFVDTHGHNGDAVKAPNPSYGYKLWLAHGVTSVRGVPFYFGGENASLGDKRRSAENTIVAPRLFAYAAFGDIWTEGAVDTPDRARAWVRWAARQGYDGVKFYNDAPPAAIAAAVDEARTHKLGTVAHLGQIGNAEVNASVAGRIGIGTITHFYGHFESLLKETSLPDYPADYNLSDEQSRFSEVANLTRQIVEPESQRWQDYLARQRDLGVTFEPTLNIYSASRDLMRARNADWHQKYTLPSLYRFFQPSRTNHGSYWHNWTTAREIAWRRFYTPYMRLMNDYKNSGGRITVGSDPGFIYQTWGFSYVQEFEMLQEAGFTPLEVIKAATINGAKTIYDPKGAEPPFGLVRAGMLADLVIAPENPLENFKTLLGTGFVRLNDDGEQVTTGGVRWTVKDGIVYDARALLADVVKMVAEAPDLSK